jgi:hypothetical protein
MMMMNLPSERRQELSREKLISKHFLTIQALTYSCCSDELECKRQANYCISSDEKKLTSKYGVAKIACHGNLIILPKPYDSEEGGKQLFSGKFGRLRYFALSVMIATSPLSREVVQLSLAFPEASGDTTPQKEEASRAPIVFPILCGHILTHIIAAMCASCGQDRARSDTIGMVPSFLADTYNETTVTDTKTTSSNFGDCKNFIQLGYIAKVLQVILGIFQQKNQCPPLHQDQWETQILVSISELLAEENTNITAWGESCCQLLRVAFQNHSTTSVDRETACSSEIHADFILNAFQSAREAGYKFLCSACLMFQVLVPGVASIFEQLDQNSGEEELCKVMDISLKQMLNSSLVCQVIGNWYNSARPKMEMNELKKRLNCKFNFRAHDWPYVIYEHKPLDINKKMSSPTNVKNTLPLLQGSVPMGRAKDNKPRIRALPISYTDLYAELGALSPNSESTAVCLVCGEVSLNMTSESYRPYHNILF